MIQPVLFYVFCSLSFLFDSLHRAKKKARTHRKGSEMHLNNEAVETQGSHVNKIMCTATVCSTKIQSSFVHSF